MIVLSGKERGKTVKKKITVIDAKGERVERVVTYIPLRYILAILLSILEVAAVISIVVLLCIHIPYFYVAAALTQLLCLLQILSSDDNADYKLPWLLFVLILPIVGFMLYFMFYSRKLRPRFLRRLSELKDKSYRKQDEAALASLADENAAAHSQAMLLCKTAETHLFRDTKVAYYPLGRDMLEPLLRDLKKAERFIFMEYFIIEEGVFWNAILDVLKEKARAGVEVRVLYDDIGCMRTLPGNYDKILSRFGIDAAPFSRLRGQADSEFNNRNHRKITVIDGRVGYTGGINLADEYIGETIRFGHWKDTALRLEGDAVAELTKLFLVDYGISVKQAPSAKHDYFPLCACEGGGGYVLPFGDGPRPIYPHAVAKDLLLSMLAGAKKSVHITTPYLIIDNELCHAIENAALRGVEVKLILPHIPDKRLIFAMSRTFYPRLLRAGVEVYEYTPGFIHAKNYIVDGEIAMTGTINLDYRSLVHHFENGVWMYRTSVIADMEADFAGTVAKSHRILREDLKPRLSERITVSLVKVFSPLL